MILPPPIAIYLQLGEPINYRQIKPGDFFYHDECLCVKTQWTRYVRLCPGNAIDTPTYSQHPRPDGCKEVRIVPHDSTPDKGGSDGTEKYRKIEEIK